MKRMLWILAAVAVSTAIFATIRYGLKPKPIPVMNATEFQDNEQIGSVIYKRLFQPVRAERIVILGSTPGIPADREMWQGFTRAAEGDGEKIVTFETVEGQSETEIAAALKAGQLIVVHGSTPEVSHLVEGSLAKRLEKLVGRPVLTLSTAPFAVTSEASEEVNKRCIDATETKSNLQRLDCASGRVARRYLKKRLSPDKIWAVMERYGLKEYLLFIHRP